MYSACIMMWGQSREGGELCLVSQNVNLRLKVAGALEVWCKFGQGQRNALPVGLVVLWDPLGLEVPSLTARKKSATGWFIYAAQCLSWCFNMQWDGKWRACNGHVASHCHNMTTKANVTCTWACCRIACACASWGDTTGPFRESPPYWNWGQWEGGVSPPLQDFPNVKKFNHTAPPCGCGTTPHWEKPSCVWYMCVCVSGLTGSINKVPGGPGIPSAPARPGRPGGPWEEQTGKWTMYVCGCISVQVCVYVRGRGSKCREKHPII